MVFIMSVSIIIPVYNVEQYIEECLRSVMRQTYCGAMECLIVDDCGTDESIAIVERLIGEYSGPIRFEILHHEHNRGVAAARNTGTMKAKGDYIYYLDSDDEITADCIEKMMAIASQDPDIEMVQGNYIRFSDGKQIHGPREISIVRASTNEEVRKCFYKERQITVYTWNKLLKRSVILDNQLYLNEGLVWEEDTAWTYCSLKYITNAYFLRDITYLYKNRPNSYITGTTQCAKEIYRLKRNHYIITHLTPGYELEELEYYTMPFIGLYLRHSYHMPELTDDLLAFMHNAWKFRKYKFCAFLVISFALRRTKRVGRYVFSLFYRLEHPTQIPKDIHRLISLCQACSLTNDKD